MREEKQKSQDPSIIRLIEKAQIIRMRGRSLRLFVVIKIYQLFWEEADMFKRPQQPRPSEKDKKNIKSVQKKKFQGGSRATCCRGEGESEEGETVP